MGDRGPLLDGDRQGDLHELVGGDVAHQRVHRAPGAPDDGLPARPGERPAVEVGARDPAGVGREVVAVEASPLLEQRDVGEAVVVEHVHEVAGLEGGQSLVAGGQPERGGAAGQRPGRLVGDRLGLRKGSDRLLDGDPLEGHDPLDAAVVGELVPSEEEAGSGVEVEALADDALLADLDDAGRVAGDDRGRRVAELVLGQRRGRRGRRRARRPQQLPAA